MNINAITHIIGETIVEEGYSVSKAEMHDFSIMLCLRTIRINTLRILGIVDI